MGAEHAIFDAFQRLLEDLERYAPLPSGTDPSGSPPLQSASVQAGPVEPEPTVEVTETPTHVYVTIEMLGVGRDPIELQAAPDALEVRAAGEHQQFVRVPLPSRVRVDAIRSTERNGVLDVVLEKDVGGPHRRRGG